MEYNIPSAVLSDIRAAAEKSGIKKVILFGSRARGTNRKTGDIDLAVSGGNAFETLAKTLAEKAAEAENGLG